MRPAGLIPSLICACALALPPSELGPRRSSSSWRLRDLGLGHVEAKWLPDDYAHRRDLLTVDRDRLAQVGCPGQLLLGVIQHYRDEILVLLGHLPGQLDVPLAIAFDHCHA